MQVGYCNVQATSVGSTCIILIFSPSNSTWIVLKAREKSKNMTTTWLQYHCNKRRAMHYYFKQKVYILFSKMRVRVTQDTTQVNVKPQKMSLYYFVVWLIMNFRLKVPSYGTNFTFIILFALQTVSGGVVVWWLAPFPHNYKIPAGAFLCSPCVLQEFPQGAPASSQD